MVARRKAVCHLFLPTAVVERLFRNSKKKVSCSTVKAFMVGESVLCGCRFQSALLLLAILLVTAANRR